MKRLLLLILLVVSGCDNAAWIPPASPDPHAILREASSDAQVGKYEEALAKHIWFHENALDYEASLSGVRSSFALGYWHDLAKKYEPAMKALLTASDTAENRVREGFDTYRSFSDFRSINRELGNNTKTVELFVWLDKNHPKRAKEVYWQAQEALIDAKQYTLAVKYIDPQSAYQRHVRSLQSFKEAYAGRPASPNRSRPSPPYRYFSESVTTLVVLLALNNRNDEAEDIAEQALLEWSDSRFEQKLENALKGEFSREWN